MPGLMLPAHAQTSIAQCTTIADDKRRLACYDAAAGRGAVRPAPPSSKWLVSSKPNPRDGSMTVIAALEATSGTGKLGKKIILVARCQSGETEVYIDWAQYLGNDSTDVLHSAKNITIRIGSAASYTESWSTSTDHSATFVPNAVDFLHNLTLSGSLTLQTTPFNAAPVSAVFTLGDAEAALRPIANACKWKF
jgi:hypothetical protein